MMSDFEDMAKTLEDNLDYRVLRRINVSPRKLSTYEGPTCRALLVDVETTGLDPLGRAGPADEIIEFAALPIRFTYDGTITEILAPFCALRQPTKPIPSDITRLTGIGDEMVRGHAIDPCGISNLLKDVTLVVAHNAKFDRPFCEALHATFAEVRWACSQTQISWAAYGYQGAKLSYLLTTCGLFHDGHRSGEDVFALAEILSRPIGDTGKSAFGVLVEEAFQQVVRIYAERAPFDKKDQLRARGYHWNSGENSHPRAWYRDVPEPDVGSELDFLCESILPRGVQPILRRIDGFDRFSTRV